MSREYARSRRVGEQIQRTLSEIIRRELKDPRVGTASVTAVEVSGDLSHARVYFSLLEPDADPSAALAGLQSASGFLRRQLGRSLKLRHVPTLHFVNIHAGHGHLRRKRGTNRKTNLANSWGIRVPPFEINFVNVRASVYHASCSQKLHRSSDLGHFYLIKSC